MRGMGDFQRAQMKHRDARVSAMAQHLRGAVDLWEEIQLYPFKNEETAEAAPPTAPPPAATPIEPPLRGRRLRQECWSLTETAYELAVSRWTLWRAARSDLPDFPQPIVVSRRLYWRKRDLERLEAAMMFFEGRCAFDRNRKATRSAG